MSLHIKLKYFLEIPKRRTGSFAESQEPSKPTTIATRKTGWPVARSDSRMGWLGEGRQPRWFCPDQEGRRRPRYKSLKLIPQTPDHDLCRRRGDIYWIRQFMNMQHDRIGSLQDSRLQTDLLTQPLSGMASTRPDGRIVVGLATEPARGEPVEELGKREQIWLARDLLRTILTRPA
ncbi:hypothetical protein TNCT_318971 [Trichonephila clavata]|uniref:Uncharacterized protein n=1 Tax=Trichonephila clavata TaxID=2740835 RepID=A0A8X6GQM5_TRICU|nr:hypothetical protein TNCT_318971 [Trichonephila clavata]